LEEVENFIDADYPCQVNFIRVMCAARIDRHILLKAAESKIDGILIIICRENECRYKDGSMIAKDRIRHTARLLNSLGYDGKRVKIIEINDPAENKNVSETIKDFSHKIESMT
jgi:coenzyme F420-reducing hydrogenase delta subunit